MNNYNFVDYVSNSVIRSVTDDLMANPQKTVEFSTRFGGRNWTLTENNNSLTFGPEQTGKIFILKRIWNAVVFFFKSWDPTFSSNFNTAMQSMNQAYQTYQASLANQLVLLPGVAPALTLPNDLIRNKIMPYLNHDDCRAMAAVCRQWKQVIDNKANGLSLLDQKLFSEVVDLENKRLVDFVGNYQMDKSGLNRLTKIQLIQILDQYKQWFMFIVDKNNNVANAHSPVAKVKYSTKNLKIMQIHVIGNTINLTLEEKVP